MSQRVRFQSTLGGELVGLLDYPGTAATGGARAWALFAHCFTCSKDLKAARWISRTLADRGFGVLRFDFTGIGESPGDFSETNFSSNVDDLVAAADFLRRERQAPALLVGHSLGGAAVLVAAGRIPECKAVATLAAPSDPAHLLESTLPEAAAATAARPDETVEVELAGRSFKVRRQLFDDLAEQSVLAHVAQLRRALLVLHSPVDRVVDVEHARRIFEAARHPKSFVSLDRADHLLMDERDARYAASVLASWAEHYLTRTEQAPEQPVPPQEGWVRVRGGSGLEQSIVSARHRWRADEPLGAPGATDRGPTPYDLLLSALGACTSMTLRMYAERKRWPLEATQIDLRHQRVHARDCEDCEPGTRIDRIEVAISLDGTLDDAQRQRLLEMASRCPVYRTLTGRLQIEERLADGTTDG